MKNFDHWKKINHSFTCKNPEGMGTLDWPLAVQPSRTTTDRTIVSANAYVWG